MRSKLSYLLALLIMFALVQPALSKDVQVGEYKKKDGTVVKAHTRTVKDKDTVKVKGYTKKDGTVVKGHERKKATKSADNK